LIGRRGGVGSDVGLPFAVFLGVGNHVGLPLASFAREEMTGVDFRAEIFVGSVVGVETGGAEVMRRATGAVRTAFPRRSAAASAASARWAGSPGVEPVGVGFGC
jgi:hypothetical protein